MGGAEAGHIRIGDSVAIFAQGPIGLCATAGAKVDGRGGIGQIRFKCTGDTPFQP